jgi:hypothetical protein
MLVHFCVYTLLTLLSFFFFTRVYLRSYGADKKL